MVIDKILNLKFVHILCFGRNHYTSIEDSLTIIVQIGSFQEKKIVVVHGNILNIYWQHVDVLFAFLLLRSFRVQFFYVDLLQRKP